MIKVIILEEPLATMVVKGIVKDIPDDYKDLLLKEETVLIASGCNISRYSSYDNIYKERYNMADVVGMPENLEILSEERFLGYARVKDGKFVDAAELSIPERLPDYIHIWNKVSNFDENSSLAIKEFIMDNNHKNEEDFETKNHIDIDKASDKNHENIQLEEKPKTNWLVILLCIVLAIPLFIFIDKIPTIFIIIAIIGEVFIWMVGGNGQLK